MNGDLVNLLNNETLKVLETRRSCRKFKSEMLREEDLNAIIRAGTFAPSGMNKQTPIIIAVTNKELRNKISEENRKIGGWNEGFDPFYGAPVILIVLADKGVSPNYIYDGSLVMENMMIAASPATARVQIGYSFLILIRLLNSLLFCFLML